MADRHSQQRQDSYQVRHYIASRKNSQDSQKGLTTQMSTKLSDKELNQPLLCSSNINVNSKNVLQFMNEPMVASHSQSKTELELKEVLQEDRTPKYTSLEEHDEAGQIEVYCWGLNDSSQLGQATSSSRTSNRNSTIPRKLSLKFTPAQIACGKNHTLFLSKDGDLWGLGDNSCGQLGLNLPVAYEPTKVYLNQRVARVECGTNFSMIQMQNSLSSHDPSLAGFIYSSGLNDEAQLCLGMLDSKVSEFMKIPLQQGITSFSCGSSQSAFLDSHYQQLWHGGNSKRLLKLELPEELSAEGMASVKCGANGLAVLTNRGSVFWKRGEYKMEQLQSLKGIYQIHACENHYVARSHSNEIFYWDQSGEVKTLSFDQKLSPSAIAQMDIGADYGHVVDASGNLYGWGNNQNGEVGSGDTYPRQKLTQIRVFNKHKQYLRCQKIYTGHNHSFSLFEKLETPRDPIVPHQSAQTGALQTRSKSYNLPKQINENSSRRDLRCDHIASELAREPSNQELRKQQYEQTQQAIFKYR